jgi:DNA-binding NarL/FixJ family response regulator
MIKDVQASIKEWSGLMPARPVWIKGPASLATVGLQRVLGGPTSCHRDNDAPPPRKPSAVVCCPDAGTPGAAPEGLASEVREALRAAPGAAVVVLAPFPDAEAARACVRAGARGFVHQGMPPEQVARAVRVAAEGEELVLSRELLRGLVAAGRRVDLTALSERQREVVGLVAEGLSNAEIARELYLSESTVKQHLRRAFRALGVKNRREAAAALRRAGFPPRTPVDEVSPLQRR